MSEDWDVDSYRTEFESEEHWELRKSFMLAHKDKLSEDEIVCLAQVFTNIEFLGCRYPDETMKKVAELAKGVVESYREKKKNCLKRTFVAASDAAASRVKGLDDLHVDNNEDTINKKKKKINLKNVNQVTYDFNEIRLNQSKCFKLKHDLRNTSCKEKDRQDRKLAKCSTSKSTLGLKIGKSKDLFENFVLFLFDGHPVNVLQRNASLNKYLISWEFNPVQNDLSISICCSVYLNEHLVGTGTGMSKKISREAASRDAIKKLQSSCYIVKIKSQVSCSSPIRPAELERSAEDQPGVKYQVGEQIMKLMGWSGGGLGVKQQGVIEPVSLLSYTGRSGLGLNDTASRGDIGFKKKAKTFILSWMKSDADQDLIFSSEFSTEQRKILHELARQFSLKAKSYGKGDKRHLAISKKPSPWCIVEELIKVGGKTEKYELIVPETPS